MKKLNNKNNSKINRYIGMAAVMMGMGVLTACGQSTEQTASAETVEESKEENGQTTDTDTSKDAAASAEVSTDAEAESSELIVFAAASMTETLTEIEESYEAAHPGVDIIYNFDSSGTLKTQIQEGADCDLFISAGQKQMDQLDITADAEVNTEGLDYVDDATRVNLLENKVTLCVPESNPKNITGFDDLTKAFESGDFLFCMGNADVPVGQYTQKILDYYGLSEEELSGAGMITYGSNVKEVTTQILEEAVDAGVIYCTDAYSAGLNIIDYATADMCGQVIYPAAVLKTAENADEAQAFLDYLQTDEAMSVFEEVGFSKVE